MLRHKLICITTALATFLWLGAIAQGGGGRPPGGGKPGGQSAPRFSSGGAKPTIQAQPRVTGGGTGVRPASFTPSKEAIKGQRFNPLATAGLKTSLGTWQGDRRGWDYPYSRHNSLFLFGLGSPFGFYGNCLPACLFCGPRYSFGYGHSFAYSPFGCSWVPGLYGSGSYPDIYGFPPMAEAPPVQPGPENVPVETQFAKQAARDFALRKYDSAARHWRHALVEDPRNPRLVLLLAQTLFQTGSFEEAAGAVQYGLSLLPGEQWNTAVPDFASLYKDNIFDYSARLRELEKARLQKADDPGLRFLLGYHYSFLGFAEESLRELDAVLKLAPTDEIAKKLREMVAAKRKPSS